ncbi:aspartyl-tRNA amidotransferase [candidate division KSB1 bacterium 4484_188]|nr:MAG: aspartyl-tRNA amidotransferase [candidate division KSB1 bacterium 4484_188]HFE63158.1 GatB/YqeY domain-containing protein [Caldithrix sp.]
MGIQQKLMDDMKAAMKSGDTLRRETIRGIRAQMKNMEIDQGRPLTEEEEIRVLISAAKKRKEAIEQFRAGNREDRAAEEEQELRIIQAYLPEQMSEEALAKLIDQTISEVQATSIKDMGKVMGKIMPQVSGRADGKVVQKMVQQKLTAL